VKGASNRGGGCARSIVNVLCQAADFGGFLYVGKYRSVSLSAALPDSDANFTGLLFESHLISLSQLALVDTVQSGQLFVSCSETLAFRYGEPIRVVATMGILVRV